ncbi:efflux ABC transporter, permease domain containing protein [Anopheles sinensis]|uniref:Efflux ABC transporter, permease domain containing protein n=1 Tax=Anopheles sinensis TaxID=74873 RepID=A0A084VWS3_ANOSI|nr:efflux ABC transporter, permease domain containing protein [Anopheles sinensis]
MKCFVPVSNAPTSRLCGGLNREHNAEGMLSMIDGYRTRNWHGIEAAEAQQTLAYRHSEIRNHSSPFANGEEHHEAGPSSGIDPALCCWGAKCLRHYSPTRHAGGARLP